MYLFNVESAKRRERVKTPCRVSYMALREYTPERDGNDWIWTSVSQTTMKVAPQELEGFAASTGTQR